MYDWRRMTEEDRLNALGRRKARRRPWHSPPHRLGPGQYIISAACYEHEPHIAYSAERLDHFTQVLLDTVTPTISRIYAWCVLPNHYHLVISTPKLKDTLRPLGLLHGRMSHFWNDEEGRRGRKVWHACTDRQMRSFAHLMASINYVHHNPVKHGYVERWQDWMWSSADEFLEDMGRERAERMWLEFPIFNYGDGWDED